MSQTITALVAAFVLMSPAGFAQDAVKVSPAMYTVLLENEHVRVLEFRCKAGEKEPMHSHPAMSAYLVTDAKYKATTPDGKTEAGEAKAGTAVWLDPVTHAWECVSDQRTILTEMKNRMKP